VRVSPVIGFSGMHAPRNSRSTERPKYETRASHISNAPTCTAREGHGIDANRDARALRVAHGADRAGFVDECA